MRLFQVDRTQFPIGQGGFHLTVLHSPLLQKSLRMVIDCGGSNTKHRKRLIERLAEGEREFDILAISHFDADHINGIADLQKEGISFKVVLLPHVDVHAYLMWMVLKLCATGMDGVGELARIVRIAGGLYHGMYGPVVLVGNKVPDTGEDTVERGSLDSGLPKIFTKRGQDALDRATDTSSEIFPHTQPLILKGYDWVLRLYTREWALSSEASMIWELPFLSNLKTLVERTNKEFNSEDWEYFATNLKVQLDASITLADVEEKLKLGNTGALEELLKSLHGLISKTLQKEISCKKALSHLYRSSKGFEDYNDASLCVYSGPTLHGGAAGREQFSRSVRLGRSDLRGGALDGAKTREVGWLSTGDSDFSEVTKLREFLQHYDAEIALTSTVVLPHHGSRHSFCSKKGDPINDMDRLRELIENLPMRPTFIAPADPEHKKYHHPHWSVESACRKAGDFYVIDENMASFYTETVRAIDVRYFPDFLSHKTASWVVY